MMNLVLIGIGAGAAAALLFASVLSGALLSIPLFYLAPLPIMIAGLGWSHWAALIAAGIGSISLGLALGTVFFFGFLADAGIPAWWLGYLAMLARPLAASGNGHEQPPLEWYPPGRIVMWAAILAAMVVIVAIPNFGTDAQTFVTGLHDALTRMLRAQMNAPDGSLKLPGGADPERFINFMVAVMPPTAAILAMLTSLLNLWLAGRVVKFSGRLTRPWPDLTAMRAPPLLAIALALAIALSFVDGLLGIVAQVVCASLLMAYAVLGFSVLHAVTRGWNGRPFVLAGTYLAMLLVSWLILAVCLLGLIDTVIDVRALVARKNSPPTSS